MLRSLPAFSALIAALALTPAIAAQTSEWTPFGNGCAGNTGVPRLEPMGFSLPFVGEVFTTEVSNLPYDGVGVGLLGLSNQFWGSIPLPADLGLVKWLKRLIGIGQELVHRRVDVALHFNVGGEGQVRRHKDHDDQHHAQHHPGFEVLDPHCPAPDP